MCARAFDLCDQSVDESYSLYCELLWVSVQYV